MSKAYCKKIDRSIRIEKIADACGIKKITSERIKDLRIEHRYTQKSLADVLRISRTVVSDWESGNKLPSVAQYCELALQFGVDIEYLVGLSKDKRVSGVCEKLRGFHDLISNIDEIDENAYKLLSEYFGNRANSTDADELIDIGIFNSQGQVIIKEIYGLLRENRKFLK